MNQVTHGDVVRFCKRELRLVVNLRVLHWNAFKLLRRSKKVCSHACAFFSTGRPGISTGLHFTWWSHTPIDGGAP